MGWPGRDEPGLARIGWTGTKQERITVTHPGVTGTIFIFIF